ncbi:DsbA family protein [Reichenbachiella agarivorans]|uniref:DsbA family protein n=1 Tax=Reichenbachiella agarivorans TaxID=2979464 RepID=A0ABY6CL61_9BACT|nr:DsbA family protein [Reichenbachiella agarivorans]UXP31266.1 DsbA family protein [Reichenbachiella agarivorans]
MKKEMNCEDGVCEVPNLSQEENLNLTTAPTEKATLMYFGDPMCSWCWGITNYLDRIKTEYKETFDFELVLGGLRPGGGDAWTEEFREMLKSHWGHVHDASGQPFDYSFFDRKEFNYDTEPSARAVRVIRDVAPDKEWAFYKTLQRLFYAENKDIQDLNVLESVCIELNIDYQSFEPLFLSEGYKKLTYQDFVKSQQMGVRGFPSVVIHKGEEYIAVTMGFADYETMKQRIDNIMAD